ncbi:hypothetical protein JCM8097_008167 [Rhodosporidiobolus ruineniae]
MSTESAFERAVAFVGSSSASSSNDTKLRLYALYKVATASRVPTTSRPGLLDWTGRAKWDAWTVLGKSFEGEADEGKERAMSEYQDEARKLGWSDAEGGEAEAAQPAVKEKKEKKEQMVAVSTMESGFVDEAPASKLHELALDGDASALEAFLQREGKSADLNERDSYGYAPLHLAVDRGNLDAAKVLLAAGADKSLTDEDGNTPLDLARLAEQDDLVALLSS